MKLNLVISLCAGLTVIGIRLSNAQGTFGNLDFEHPNLPLTPDSNFMVPITNGMPEWNGYIGGIQVTSIVYDTFALDAAEISVHDTSSVLKPLQGNYSVFLQGSSSSAPAQSAAIAQTGVLSADVKSITFFAGTIFFDMQVTVAGQNIPLVQLGSTPAYNIMGGDISTFAGQTEELRFTAPALGGGYIDNIIFSTQPVPEPSAWTLMLCGAAALAIRGRFRRI